MKDQWMRCNSGCSHLIKRGNYFWAVLYPPHLAQTEKIELFLDGNLVDQNFGSMEEAMNWAERILKLESFE